MGLDCVNLALEVSRLLAFCLIDMEVGIRPPQPAKCASGSNRERSRISRVALAPIAEKNGITGAAGGGELQRTGTRLDT